VSEALLGIVTLAVPFAVAFLVVAVIIVRRRARRRDGGS
jgi:hypothetical protein